MRTEDISNDVMNAAFIMIAGFAAAVIAVCIAVSCVFSWWVGIVLFLALMSVSLIAISVRRIKDLKMKSEHE